MGYNSTIAILNASCKLKLQNEERIGVQTIGVEIAMAFEALGCMELKANLKLLAKVRFYFFCVFLHLNFLV